MQGNVGTESTIKPWWGDFSVPEGEQIFWKIGPLKLWVFRSNREWRVSVERSNDPLQKSLSIAESSRPAPGPKAVVTRYGFKQTQETARLVPLLADQPVIVNPAQPFVLPRGEEVTLYVSSPVWFRFDVGKLELHEEPVYPPSETWFGPSTRVGEACFASRTAARLDLADLPIRPQRALSAMRIRNRAKTKLLIERLKLPAPNLSLFAGASGHLWTEAVILDRELDGEDAAVRLDKGSGPAAPSAKLVSGPRTRVEKGALMRAFGSLFQNDDGDRQ